MRCAHHPGVETNLRCATCGKPICPKCMVQTPVSVKCPECAALRKLPTFQVSPAYYLRAAGSGIGMAIVSGIVWKVLGAVLPFFYFNLLLAPAAGYAIAEVIGLSVNRKRSKGLAAVAGAALVLSYVVSIIPIWGVGFFIFSLQHIVLDLLAVGLGVFVAVNRLR
ncbi:B-box zinc finger protein [Chloroflexota bacterium]